MKLTKILSLAAVAVVAVMAFAGNASAVVSHPLIILCKAQELLLCQNVNTLKLAGVLVDLQIGTGTWEGTLNQKCTSSKITKKTGAMAGTEAESKLLGEITSLKFTGCEPCKKITTGPPYTANFKMKGAAGGWTVESGLSFHFEECSFKENCTFEATELNPEPTIEMTATEAILNTNKAVLKRTEGNEFFCGASVKWNAKYKLELELPDGTVHNVWPTLCETALPEEKCQ